MKKSLFHLFAALMLLSFGTKGFGKDEPTVTGPVAYVFAKPGGVELKNYVFTPKGVKAGPPRAAIVLYYGGGWAMGDPTWAFGRAQHFAERGMVAVAAQYRLSDQ